MNKYFTYSILQYKHNLILGEIINVGILFYFIKDNHFEFVRGNGHRAKAIYPDFDNTLFNGYINTITKKIKTQVDLFNKEVDKTDFRNYIHQYILAQDASGLIFKDPVSIEFSSGNVSDIVEQYSQLLLPGIITDTPKVIVKHNENFILKTFQGYLIKNNTTIEKKFKKNQIIKAPHFNIKFDLSWKVKTTNYIKPLSFDVTDENTIQNKAAILYSHLTDLKEYAKKNDTRFDILIAPPQESDYRREFENALDFIDSVQISKRLVNQTDWEDYSEEASSLLS
jgi:hypothetical protein